MAGRTSRARSEAIRRISPKRIPTPVSHAKGRFRDALVERGLRPHVALRCDPRQRPLLDKRTTNSVGYRLSQIFRRKVEGVIGWLKDPGRMKRARLRGLERVNHQTYFAGAAHNLLRIVNLSRAAVTTG